MKKFFLAILAMLILVNLLNTTVCAHSGRTDEDGGHMDHSDGTYHYHCGGHPAHQHPNGVCPYKTTNNQEQKYENNDGYPYKPTNNQEQKAENNNDAYIVFGVLFAVAAVVGIRAYIAYKKDTNGN